MATSFRDVMLWVASKEFLALPPDQLRQLYDEMNRQLKLKKALAVSNFRSGDSVKFQGKYGESVTGVVLKGNRTTIQVKASDGRMWRVSPALLQKA